MPSRSSQTSSPTAAPRQAFREWTDADLLCDSSDPAESFATFYRRHVGAVIRFAAGRGVDADAVADVVSDTFMAALRSRQQYRPQQETARLWLLTIASRRIIDARRRHDQESRRHQRLRDEALVLTHADRDAYRDLVERDGLVDDALADLPAVQQQAIRARVIHERDYAEIAAALGLSPQATRQHVSRGLARLRNLLARTHDR
ncbi:MAG TPA: sigma-70 family RNA polymerase sigma factor [Baekduia sp.]|nr:sigma-70 family RNA polymerase sigma factor [Baekduia sp.]